MSIRKKQSSFAVNVAQLIWWANWHGYEVTFGDAWRSPEECIRRGMPNSLHGDRLAIDLNLFKDGLWLKETIDHRPLGEFWLSLDPDNAWGGDFGDGNHYSRKDKGRK